MSDKKDDNVLEFKKKEQQPKSLIVVPKTYSELLDPARNDDAYLRNWFLDIWTDATESPRYDADKWNLLRDMLRERGIRL